MNQLAEIEHIRENLRSAMERKGVKPTTLSLQVGRSKTLVKDLLEKTKDVNVGTLTRLASALDVDIMELLSRPRVLITGLISSGGLIIFEDLRGNIAERPTAPAMPGLAGTIVALMVEGDAMMPKYRAGDVVYIQEIDEGVDADCMGRDCAVMLADGQAYIKEMSMGSKPGKFTLRSLSAADMVDVDVTWATPIIAILPQHSRLIAG